MIRAIHGKSHYGMSSAATLFDELISPSKESFALLLCRNGYENWVWMHNHASLSLGGLMPPVMAPCWKEKKKQMAVLGINTQTGQVT
jgi:hypothetical protein